MLKRRCQLDASSRTKTIYSLWPSSLTDRVDVLQQRFSVCSDCVAVANQPQPSRFWAHVCRARATFSSLGQPKKISTTLTTFVLSAAIITRLRRSPPRGRARPTPSRSTSWHFSSWPPIVWDKNQQQQRPENWLSSTPIQSKSPTGNLKIHSNPFFWIHFKMQFFFLSCLKNLKGFNQKLVAKLFGLAFGKSHWVLSSI